MPVPLRVWGMCDVGVNVIVFKKFCGQVPSHRNAALLTMPNVFILLKMDLRLASLKNLFKFDTCSFYPKDPFVCPKISEFPGSNPMTWGWDLDHQSYSKEGSGPKQVDVQKICLF